VANVHSQSLVALVERAGSAPRSEFARFIREGARQVLIALAGNPNLGEPELLILLKRKDLPREAVQGIASRTEAGHSYRIKLSIVRHPRCPRQLALPLLKFLFLFDLLKVCQSPAVPADIKMVAEEMILKRSEGIPRGEKISLARRATGRVAASLLFSHDMELIEAALDNPFLTEAHLLKVLSRTDGVDELLVEKVARHAKWSHRYHIRLSLLRIPSLPFHQVLAFVPDLTVSDLRTICLDPKMNEKVRKYLWTHCEERLKDRKQKLNSKSFDTDPEKSTGEGEPSS
jgi:hypothetical protein